MNFEQQGGRHHKDRKGKKPHHRRHQRGGENGTYKLVIEEDKDPYFVNINGEPVSDSDKTLLETYVQSIENKLSNINENITDLIFIIDGTNVTDNSTPKQPINTLNEEKKENLNIIKESQPTTTTGGVPTKIRIGNKVYQLYVKMDGEFVTIKRAMAMVAAKKKKKAASKRK